MTPKNARLFLLWGLAVDVALFLAVVADVYVYRSRHTLTLLVVYAAFVAATVLFVILQPSARARRPGAAAGGT